MNKEEMNILKQTHSLLIIFLLSSLYSFSQNLLIASSIGSMPLKELYYGLENEVYILIENSDCNDISLTIDSSSILKDGCRFIVKTNSKQNLLQYNIWIKDSLVYCSKFLILDAPDPYIYIKGLHPTEPTGARRMKLDSVIAESKAKNVIFKIISFDVEIISKNLTLYRGHKTTVYFTEEEKSHFMKLYPKDKIILRNILVEGSDSTIRVIKYLEIAI